MSVSRSPLLTVRVPRFFRRCNTAIISRMRRADTASCWYGVDQKCGADWRTTDGSGNLSRKVFLDVGWYNDVFWALRKLEAPGRRRHCPNQIIESHASPRAPPRLHLCMPWVQVCMRVLIASIFISCLSQWVTGLCGERLALDAFVLYTVVYRYTCLILRLIEVVIYRQAK